MNWQAWVLAVLGHKASTSRQVEDALKAWGRPIETSNLTQVLRDLHTKGLVHRSEQKPIVWRITNKGDAALKKYRYEAMRFSFHCPHTEDEL